MSKCARCNEHGAKYVVRNGDRDRYCYKCIDIANTRQECMDKQGDNYDPEPFFYDNRGFWDMFR